jgi:hypothetical protein
VPPNAPEVLPPEITESEVQAAMKESGVSREEAIVFLKRKKGTR